MSVRMRSFRRIAALHQSRWMRSMLLAMLLRLWKAALQRILLRVQIVARMQPVAIPLQSTHRQRLTRELV